MLYNYICTLRHNKVKRPLDFYRFNKKSIICGPQCIEHGKFVHD